MLEAYWADKGGSEGREAARLRRRVLKPASTRQRKQNVSTRQATLGSSGTEAEHEKKVAETRETRRKKPVVRPSTDASELNEQENAVRVSESAVHEEKDKKTRAESVAGKTSEQEVSDVRKSLSSSSASEEEEVAQDIEPVTQESVQEAIEKNAEELMESPENEVVSETVTETASRKQKEVSPASSDSDPKVLRETSADSKDQTTSIKSSDEGKVTERNESAEESSYAPSSTDSDEQEQGVDKDEEVLVSTRGAKRRLSQQEEGTDLKRSRRVGSFRKLSDSLTVKSVVEETEKMRTVDFEMEEVDVDELAEDMDMHAESSRKPTTEKEPIALTQKALSRLSPDDIIFDPRFPADESIDWEKGVTAVRAVIRRPDNEEPSDFDDEERSHLYAVVEW